MMAQLKAGTASTKRGSAPEPQRSAEGTRMTSKLTCDMSVGNPDTSIGDGGFFTAPKSLLPKNRHQSRSVRSVLASSKASYA